VKSFRAFENHPGVQIDISDTTREQLVQAALGLTAMKRPTFSTRHGDERHAR
jgi:hypothetical protein